MSGSVLSHYLCLSESMKSSWQTHEDPFYRREIEPWRRTGKSKEQVPIRIKLWKINVQRHKPSVGQCAVTHQAGPIMTSSAEARNNFRKLQPNLHYISQVYSNLQRDDQLDSQNREWLKTAFLPHSDLMNATAPNPTDLATNVTCLYPDLISGLCKYCTS